jgi:hypothetical protein
MNNIARKLVLSALAVVLTVVALGTTTFAWFTLTNTAVVQPFEAQVVADTGIEVAIGVAPGGDLELLDWVTTLTTSDINDYITAAYPTGFRFDHVTTTNGIDFFTLLGGALSGTTEGFLELPIHFRSNSATSINWTQVTLTGGALPWTSDVAFTAANGTAYTAGSSFNVDASDSIRIAIQEVTGGGSALVAYEKPASATNMFLGTGGDFTDLVTLADDNLGAAGSYNYYYAKTGFLPVGSGAVVTVSTLDAITSSNILTMNDGVAAGLTQLYYGQITIRIWVEGYDQNAYNSILARLITSSFTFVGA